VESKTLLKGQILISKKVRDHMPKNIYSIIGFPKALRLLTFTYSNLSKVLCAHTYSGALC